MRRLGRRGFIRIWRGVDEGTEVGSGHGTNGLIEAGCFYAGLNGVCPVEGRSERGGCFAHR